MSHRAASPSRAPSATARHTARSLERAEFTRPTAMSDSTAYVSVAVAQPDNPADQDVLAVEDERGEPLLFDEITGATGVVVTYGSDAHAKVLIYALSFVGLLLIVAIYTYTGFIPAHPVGAYDLGHGGSVDSSTGRNWVAIAGGV